MKKLSWIGLDETEDYELRVSFGTWMVMTEAGLIIRVQSYAIAGECGIDHVMIRKVWDRGGAIGGLIARCPASYLENHLLKRDKTQPFWELIEGFNIQNGFPRKTYVSRDANLLLTLVHGSLSLLHAPGI